MPLIHGWLLLQMKILAHDHMHPPLHSPLLHPDYQPLLPLLLPFLGYHYLLHIQKCVYIIYAGITQAYELFQTVVARRL